MKERMTYAARLCKDEYGYTVEFPQLDLVTQGNDLDDALCMASDALETYFFDYLHDKDGPPAPDLDIELHSDDIYVIVSVDVAPLIDGELTTEDVMKMLCVNKQRVAQLRASGKIAAYKQGRDYLHSRSDVEVLRHSARKSGRPRKELLAA
ncbi:MAG: type II toxin-antitoxin system HicB family antitoxin [Coriobacteriia bacterium]|nr:type II toxin-antitoxin system HicB family antitoxin [Coriobacteriia bacterium]